MSPYPEIPTSEEILEGYIIAIAALPHGEKVHKNIQEGSLLSLDELLDKAKEILSKEEYYGLRKSAVSLYSVGYRDFHS
jgi:hypothetical protein